MTRRQRQRRERSTGLVVVVLVVAAVGWIRPHDYYPEAAATPAPAIESIEPTRAPTARPTAIPRRTKPLPAATIDAGCIDTNDPDAIQGAIDDGRLGLDAWDDPDNIEEAC